MLYNFHIESNCKRNADLDIPGSSKQYNLYAHRQFVYYCLKGTVFIVL